MTTPSEPGNSTQPAGWFPDPSGGQGKRWWDGERWTEHVSDPALEAFSAGAVPGKVDPSTPVYTPYIWAIVLLPILSLITLLFWDANSYMRLIIDSPNDPFVQYRDASYLLIQGLGFVLYAATVLLAYFDSKMLKTRGFDRPFHWAWAFLGSTVYIIGRTVVVRRRGGRGGLLPIWIMIGLIVLTLVVATVKVIGIFSTVMSYTNTMY